MARRGKWVSKLSPDSPAAKGAEKALSGRLETLQKWLPLAAEKPDEDPEHVHQLRVASRRAMAALDVFRQFLAPEDAEWLAKHLKKVRQSAGDARDLDVLSEWLNEHSDEADRAAFTWCGKTIHSARRKAQRPIEKVYHRWRKKARAERIDEILRRLEPRESNDAPPPPPDFGSLARASLRPVVEEVARDFTAGLETEESLHAFRIVVKRLRYSMELFAAAFEPAFRTDVYPIVAELQESLGRIHDHAVFRDQLAAWVEAGPDKEVAEQLAAWRADEMEKLAAARTEFESTWKDGRIPELIQQLEAFIAPPGAAIKKLKVPAANHRTPGRQKNA